MGKSSISINMLNLVNDPIKIAIWFDIMRSDGITAKAIAKKLNLKGTNIYYHLKHLEEKKIILSKTNIVEGTNLIEKTYRINKKFYGAEEREVRHKFRDSPEKMRDAILFQLYQTAFMVGKQIMEVSKLSNEEVKEQLENRTLPFIKSILFNELDMKKASEILFDTISSLDEIRAGKDQAENERNADYGIVVGLISLFE
ncbi:MAG: winged helix-turn-helix domain-containing protein [Candidatus Heimdallarchaeaceae archaeon]